MISRTLEPEVMDTVREARDYDAMDHQSVNAAFVTDFISVFDAAGRGLHPPRSKSDVSILDIGTGTARIPIFLAARNPTCRITAVDLSAEMLKVAKENIQAAELGHRIDTVICDCKSLVFADGSFDAVISNSIIHHLPEPVRPLREMVRVLRHGGTLFVRDLLRPASEQDVEGLVDTYAAHEPEPARQMLRASLHAALTVDEVREALAAAGLPERLVAQTSDRHWTIAGVIG